MLHSAVKSQLCGILEEGTNTNYEQPNADTVIMDDTFLINVSMYYLATKCLMIMPLRLMYLILSRMLGNTPDMMYHQDNLKSETWQKRNS